MQDANTDDAAGNAIMSLRGLRCVLQAAAWQVFAKVTRVPDAPIRVVVQDDDSELVVVLQPKGSNALRDPESESGLYRRHLFSPLEQLVIQTIGRGKLIAKAIAAKTRHQDANGQANYQLRSILNNLCERKVIEDEDGYGLTKPGLFLACKLGLVAEPNGAS